MANGSDAQAAGMDLVPASSPNIGEPGKVAMGYDQMNKTRDYVAQFFTKAKQYAEQLVSSKVDKSQVMTDGNTAAAGKIPIYASGLQLTAGTPTLSGHVATKAYVDGRGGQLSDYGTFLRADGKSLGSSLDVFGQNLWSYAPTPAVSQYTVAYLNGDGRLGKGASSRRFKKEISAWSPDKQAVLALQLVTFRYRASVYGSDDAPLEVGLIAEELHDLGLRWLVIYDDKNRPEAIHYERIALALLPVVQDHEARLQALEQREA